MTKVQKKRSRAEIILVRMLKIILAILAPYYFLAYWILPALWTHYEHHPKLEGAPKITYTREGIPGDALNVGLVGSREDVIHSMLAAGWFPADPITFRTSLHIAGSAVFGRAYPTAPVSNLYVFGRMEDMAFEQPVAGNTRERNHVRFWKSEELGKGGKPFWIGAATFDRSVGMSHFTGEITHHIAPDIDATRDKLMADLADRGQLVTEYHVTGVGATVSGRNGGGDRYFTDGEMSVGELTQSGEASKISVVELPDPVSVRAKNRVWIFLRWLFNRF